MSEIRGICQAMQCEITAIACDSQAYEPIKILTLPDVVAASKNFLRGGGGTDMIVGIEAALALRPTPDACVVLTDGYTPYPAAPYSKVDVIFGIIQCGSSYSPPRPSVPPWSKTDIIDIPLE